MYIQCLLDSMISASVIKFQLNESSLKKIPDRLNLLMDLSVK